MKKFLSVALALAMTLSLVVVGASAKSFTDNSKIKYGEAVDVVSAVKIVDGYTDGSFNPANTLTRGAAAKIICNMMLGPTTASALGVSTAPFKDVSVKNVFAGYIAYCAKQGIINGYADKTFRPSGTVTGYQFLKMLLGALGYDSAIEGFTGTNWEVTVAKLASNLKLFSGNDTFNGNKAMTREEACLYAYNTLTTNMVEYETKGSSIVVNGITINQGASKAKPIARTTGTDYTGAAETATGTLQFCEQYFPKLTYSNTTDAFQAPAEKWKNGSSTIGSYTYDADETYTAPVSVGKIYSDLGLSATPKTLTVYEDGKQVAAASVKAITRGGTDTYGGNGTKTEVFANNSAKTDITIVVINTYVGRVSSVTAATAAKDRYVSESTLSTLPSGFTLTNTFETDKFAAKDLVSFTAAWNGSSAYEIQDMNALTKTATGKLASYTAGKTLTVADKTYDFSAKAAIDNGIGSYTPGSSDMDVYCDANGYALYVEGTQGVTNYATVIGRGSANAYGSTSTGVTLLLADGTQKAVTAKMATSSAALTGDNTVNKVIGDLVTYSVDTNGVYTLTVAQAYSAANAGQIGFKNGQPGLTINGATNLYTTNSTVFFVATKADSAPTDALPTYSVYTGYAKMPTLAAANSIGIAYSANSAHQVSAVYLSVKGLSGVSAVDTYILKSATPATTTDANGTYYVLPAIVDGKVTTVKIDPTIIVKSDKKVSELPVGVYALNNVLTNNGIITSATALAENGDITTDPYHATVGIASADKGVIGVGTGDGQTLKYLAYNDDKTVVSTVDKDCTAFTASSVSAIGTDKTVHVYYTVDITTGVATNIILVPEAVQSAPAPVNTNDYAISTNGTVISGVNYYNTAAHDDLTLLGQIQAYLKTVGYTGFSISYTPSDANSGTYTIKATNGTLTMDYTWLNTNKTSCVKVNVDGTAKLVATGTLITAAGGTGTYAMVDGSPVPTSSAVADGKTYATGYYKLTVDGTPSYLKKDATQAITGTGTGYVVDNTTYAAYGTFTMPAADKTIVTGYVKVVAPAAVTVTGATNSVTGATAATGTPNVAYVKVGSAVTLTVTTTANASATMGATISVAVTGAASPASQDLTLDQVKAGVAPTFNITAGETDITVIATTIVDKA